MTHHMDNPNIKWSGTVSIKSNYKDLGVYFCSESEDLVNVFEEILDSFKNKDVLSVKIYRVGAR